MATGGSVNGDSEEWERTKNARNIQELFKGRMTPDEAAKILRHFGWDRGQAVSYILEAGPGKLAQLINTLNKENDNARTDIEERISFVKKNDVLRDLARRNEISASVRQFACGDCDNMWWRRVPNRKPVSRCMRCRRKFDALDPGDEWGWAQFDCDCGNTFKGTGHMGRSKSMCFHCGMMCEPSKILPPLRKEDRQRRSRNKHSCAGENCFNKKGRGNPGQMCLHPKSLPCAVQCCSRPHTSTGSTVLTFLDQSDIQPAYEPSLSGIPEVADEVSD